MPIPALITGGASLLGGIFSARGQRDANRENARQAQLNRAFQERMSNTQVQRRAKDMEAAGINRILAGKYDASSPAGSMPAGMQNVAGAGVEAASKIATSAMQIAQIQNIRADTRAKQGQAVLGETKGSVYKWLLDQIGVVTEDTEIPEMVNDAKSVSRRKGAKTFPLREEKLQPGTALEQSKYKQNAIGYELKDSAFTRRGNEAGLEAVEKYLKTKPNANRKQIDAVYRRAARRSKQGN